VNYKKELKIKTKIRKKRKSKEINKVYRKNKESLVKE